MDVIDFSWENRSWGNNFSLLTKYDEDGKLWQIAVWYNKPIKKGDMIFLGIHPTRCVPYRVLSVEPCGNPADMYFLEVEFAPRVSSERSKSLQEKQKKSSSKVSILALAVVGFVIYFAFCYGKEPTPLEWTQMVIEKMRG